MCLCVYIHYIHVCVYTQVYNTYRWEFNHENAHVEAIVARRLLSMHVCVCTCVCLSVCACVRVCGLVRPASSGGCDSEDRKSVV